MKLRPNTSVRSRSRPLRTLAAVLLCCCTNTWALGLLDGYRSALVNDPNYRSARQEREATQQALPMARSTLLPTLSISAGNIAYGGQREALNSLTNTSEDLDYNSIQRSLNLRAPLINADGVMRYKQAEAQLAYSDALFSVRTKDLLNRFASAYFDFLLAMDSLHLLEAQSEAYREQRTMAQRQLQGGEGTKTEVAETEARLDLSEAQLIDVRDQIDIARRTLGDITGQDVSNVRPLRNDFVPPPIVPSRLEDWLAMAATQSPEVLTRQYSVQAARFEVSRNWAGHLPKLDLVAGVSRSSNESVNTLGQRYTTRSIGLQLSIPLYSGGYTSAATRQAVANLGRAESDLDAERNTSQIEIRRQFLAVANGLDRLNAYAKAVKSSEVALEGVRQGMRAGIRTNAEVLDAQRQLFIAKRDLAKARYDYLVARMKLKAAAGASIEEAIAEADRFLER